MGGAGKTVCVIAAMVKDEIYCDILTCFAYLSIHFSGHCGSPLLEQLIWQIRRYYEKYEDGR